MNTQYKGYQFETVLGRFKKIKAIGRGAVPNDLKGMFTSNREAEKAVDFYLSLPRGNQNVEAEAPSGV